jgi:hypothetical protein
MKNLKILSITLLFFIPICLNASVQKTKVLKPKNAETKIITIVAGKNRVYYPVNIKNSTIVTVRGPGKIKVLTRARFNSNQLEQVSYNILYKVDGDELLKTGFTNVKKSNNAKYKNNSLGIPGDSRSFEIELEIGDHTIELWNAEVSLNIDARYLFTPVKAKKKKWIALSPIAPFEPVDLITNEDIVHYYRFTKKQPLKFKVIGPTIIQVLSRIENHYDMKGRINYRLQVKEDGTIRNTYLLCSTRSDVTSYKRDKTKIPGKAKEIIFKVPKGVHYYEIIPLDKDKSTVLGRILFPKKDIKLEE